MIKVGELTLAPDARVLSLIELRTTWENRVRGAYITRWVTATWWEIWLWVYLIFFSLPWVYLIFLSLPWHTSILVLTIKSTKPLSSAVSLLNARSLFRNKTLNDYTHKRNIGFIISEIIFKDWIGPNNISHRSKYFLNILILFI